MDNNKIIFKIINKIKKDKSVLGVLLAGSAVSGGFDQYSDVDIYVLSKKKNSFSRSSYRIDNIRVDVIIDTIKESKEFLSNEKNKVSRNQSHLLANGKILYSRTNDLGRLQKIAKSNLRTKTKVTKKELIMHKYSIDDFWSEVERFYQSKNIFAFERNCRLLEDNIIELFLKIKGEYFRRPNELFNILEKKNKNFSKLLMNYYKVSSLTEKRLKLLKLKNYILKISGGKLPGSYKV